MFQVMYQDKFFRGIDICLRTVNTEAEAEKYIETQCLDLIEEGHTLSIKEIEDVCCVCCAEPTNQVFKCKCCGKLVCVACLNHKNGYCLDCEDICEVINEFWIKEENESY